MENQFSLSNLITFTICVIILFYIYQYLFNNNNNKHNYYKSNDKTKCINNKNNGELGNNYFNNNYNGYKSFNYNNNINNNYIKENNADFSNYSSFSNDFNNNEQNTFNNCNNISGTFYGNEYQNNNKLQKSYIQNNKKMYDDYIDNKYNNKINKGNLEKIDNTYNADKEIYQIGYILAKIKEEPKIGLNNIGATCYMNATLQCLSHTIKLSNYFLNPKNKDLITSPENIFSISFLEVLKKLWIKEYNNNKSNYSPYNFKNIISEMNPLFQGVAANDAKDLVSFILQQLHTELNLSKNNNINNNSNLNQNDEQGMFRFFLETFKENNRSVISDIFFGIIETITECLNCKQINLIKGIFNTSYVYNFQIINFIIFPLEEVRKMKSEINNFYFNEVNLYDCFDYYERPEVMQGDNQMWCKNCRQNSPANYMTRIYSPPMYFILILNRGKGNIYNIKLNFEEFIDIGKYVQMKQNKNLVYQLYAIVTHLGPSSMSGHFIAFCKSPIDNKWYKYNDSQVSLIGNFSNDIHEFGCPYILFYEGQGL